MRSKMFTLMFILVFAVPMFAQGNGTTGSSSLPINLALGIAAAGCGLGQGRAVASAAEGIARNPGAAGAIRTLAFIGLAFMESLVLFTFLTAR
jgi:F-type H+-transporting ATPase subunit c